MNITVGGEDNPALDVESRKEAELVRISEDTTAKKKVVVVSKKQNVFEMTTIGRNEPAAKTEQAINPNKLSDAIMLQRSLYFMGGGAIISFLIATTALVLVLIIMSQSPSITLKDPGTVHGKISVESNFLSFFPLFKIPNIEVLPCPSYFHWTKMLTVNFGLKRQRAKAHCPFY